MIKIFLAAVAAASGLAIVGMAAAGVGAANAEQTAGMRGYAPAQAISHSFGSKHAIGYFASENGNCKMTLFVTEANDAHLAPSAARIRFTVKPGDSAELMSAEGQTLEVKCGEKAAAVEVRQTGLVAAAITQ